MIFILNTTCNWNHRRRRHKDDNFTKTTTDFDPLTPMPSTINDSFHNYDDPFNTINSTSQVSEELLLEQILNRVWENKVLTTQSIVCDFFVEIDNTTIRTIQVPPNDSKISNRDRQQQLRLQRTKLLLENIHVLYHEQFSPCESNSTDPIQSHSNHQQQNVIRMKLSLDQNGNSGRISLANCHIQSFSIHDVIEWYDKNQNRWKKDDDMNGTLQLTIKKQHQQLPPTIRIPIRPFPHYIAWSQQEQNNNGNGLEDHVVTSETISMDAMNAKKVFAKIWKKYVQVNHTISTIDTMSRNSYDIAVADSTTNTSIISSIQNDAIDVIPINPTNVFTNNVELSLVPPDDSNSTDNKELHLDETATTIALANLTEQLFNDNSNKNIDDEHALLMKSVKHEAYIPADNDEGESLQFVQQRKAPDDRTIVSHTQGNLDETIFKRTTQVQSDHQRATVPYRSSTKDFVDESSRSRVGIHPQHQTYSSHRMSIEQMMQKEMNDIHTILIVMCTATIAVLLFLVYSIQKQQHPTITTMRSTKSNSKNSDSGSSRPKRTKSRVVHSIGPVPCPPYSKQNQIRYNDQYHHRNQPNYDVVVQQNDGTISPLSLDPAFLFLKQRQQHEDDDDDSTVPLTPKVDATLHDKISSNSKTIVTISSPPHANTRSIITPPSSNGTKQRQNNTIRPRRYSSDNVNQDHTYLRFVRPVQEDVATKEGHDRNELPHSTNITLTSTIVPTNNCSDLALNKTVIADVVAKKSRIRNHLLRNANITHTSSNNCLDVESHKVAKATSNKILCERFESNDENEDFLDYTTTIFPINKIQQGAQSVMKPLAVVTPTAQRNPTSYEENFVYD